MSENQCNYSEIMDGIMKDVITLYKLDDSGVNLWSAQFQRGGGYPEEVAHLAAQKAFDVLTNHDALLREAAGELNKLIGYAQGLLIGAGREPETMDIKSAVAALSRIRQVLGDDK